MSKNFDLSKPGFLNFSVIKKHDYQQIHFYLENNFINNSYFVILYTLEEGLFNINNHLENINVLLY